MPGENHRTRRGLLRALFTFGVVGGTSAALTPVVRAGRRPDLAAPAPGPEAQAPAPFDGMYRGRRLQIGPETAESRVPATGISPASSGASRLSPGSPFGVRIDGRPLRVMRRADGSYLSVVNHYESFPTLLEAARAAVDDLGGAQLSLSGPIHHL
ncbi:tyrosinase family oxidase copper chaperone [Streptomyces sp. NPDC088725]|uniref:tyrosinase family oxidase copper chaperone n=1 Tax=Streptomyces sp. NPDC088725 TaxID=3365873 RepID=UPI0037FDDC56